MSDAEHVERIERWFEEHGLPYFVGDQADEVEEWLWSWRVAAVAGAILVAAVGAGLLVGQVIVDEDRGAWGSFVAVVVLVVLVGGYAGGLLRMGTMLRWALRRTFSSLGLMFPLLTRALPLLLLAVTFLFINAEVWQVAALMSRQVLWATVGFFVLLASIFLLARLPEEVARVESEVVGDRIRRAARGTPAAALARASDFRDPALPRFARVNLVLVLMFNQAIQVFLLSVLMYWFFVIFGLLAISPDIIESWTGKPAADLPSLAEYLPISNDLFQVSVFLAAFAGLYFTVYAVTDGTYREQFFSSLDSELEQAVAVHAVYATLRHDDPDEVEET